MTHPKETFQWLTVIPLRELEKELVPEWRVMYFDYKVGAVVPQWYTALGRD
jgi:hypothetical protein